MGLLLALQAHGAEEGAPGFSSPFEVNFGLFFWTWVVFILLFLVLKRFAWPAILKATEAREQRIQQQLSETERLNSEARATLDEHKKLLSGARQEAQQLLATAKVSAEKEREQLLARTRQDQEQMLERARKEIAGERDKAIAELRREAVDLSLAAASKLMGERLTGDADRKLVERYLAGLEGKK